MYFLHRAFRRSLVRHITVSEEGHITLRLKSRSKLFQSRNPFDNWNEKQLLLFSSFYGRRPLSRTARSERLVSVSAILNVAKAIAINLAKPYFSKQNDTMQSKTRFRYERDDFWFHHTSVKEQAIDTNSFALPHSIRLRRSCISCASQIVKVHACASAIRQTKSRARTFPLQAESDPLWRKVHLILLANEMRTSVLARRAKRPCGIAICCVLESL